MTTTDRERRAQWKWVQLHRATAAEAVYLAGQGFDARLPGAVDLLTKLRGDRQPR
jgi:hypothetical protein